MNETVYKCSNSNIYASGNKKTEYNKKNYLNGQKYVYFIIFFGCDKKDIHSSVQTVFCKSGNYCACVRLA